MTSYSLGSVVLVLLIAIVAGQHSLCRYPYGRPPVVKPLHPSPESCASLPNELFIDGGPDCQLTCENLFDCCTVRHIQLVRDCFCKPGTARSPRGDCIPLASVECIRAVRNRAPLCRN